MAPLPLVGTPDSNLDTTHQLADRLRVRGGRFAVFGPMIAFCASGVATAIFFVVRRWRWFLTRMPRAGLVMGVAALLCLLVLSVLYPAKLQGIPHTPLPLAFVQVAQR